MPAKLRTGPEYLLAALTRQKIFWFIRGDESLAGSSPFILRTVFPAVEPASCRLQQDAGSTCALFTSPRGDTIWIMESIPRSIITRFNGSETQASAYSHHHRQNHTDNHLFHIIHSPYFRVLFTQLLP